MIEKNTFVVGWMTQYMLIIGCIYIVVPQQKWILLFKIKAYGKKGRYSIVKNKTKILERVIKNFKLP